MTKSRRMEASFKAVFSIASRLSNLCWIANITNVYTNIILLGQVIQPRAKPGRTVEVLVSLYLPAPEKQLSVAGFVQFWTWVLFSHKARLSSRHRLHWVVFTSAAVEIKSRKKALTLWLTSVTLWKHGSKCSSRHWRNITVREKRINIFTIEQCNGLSFFLPRDIFYRKKKGKRPFLLVS